MTDIPRLIGIVDKVMSRAIRAEDRDAWRELVELMRKLMHDYGNALTRQSVPAQVNAKLIEKLREARAERDALKEQVKTLSRAERESA